MLPWVSIAAFGAPAVPLVNNRAARWSGSTSTAGAGSAAMISLAAVASGISALSAATTVRSDGTDVPVDVTPRRRPRAIDHHGDGPDRGDLGGQFVGRAGRIERHGYGADAERCQVGDDERHAIAAHDGDAISVGDPAGEQPTACPGDVIGQFAVRRRAVAADDRDVAGIVAVDDRRQVHAAPCCRPE